MLQEKHVPEESFLIVSPTSIITSEEADLEEDYAHSESNTCPLSQPSPQISPRHEFVRTYSIQTTSPETSGPFSDYTTHPSISTSGWSGLSCEKNDPLMNNSDYDLETCMSTDCTSSGIAEPIPFSGSPQDTAIYPLLENWRPPQNMEEFRGKSEFYIDEYSMLPDDEQCPSCHDDTSGISNPDSSKCNGYV